MTQKQKHYLYQVIFTVFLSAYLLFSVQPLFSRMVLPMLGGSAMVWNTAMVFFQTLLLAGYGYVHLSTSYLKYKHQTVLHICILLLGCLFLPLSVVSGWTPPVDGTPVFWLLGLFAVSLGVPFFALSATAPLLQKWYSLSDREDADNPYFLYSASNLGSMIALLSYPLLVEPFMHLGSQSVGWSSLFVFLVLMMFLSIFVLKPSKEKAVENNKEETEEIDTKRRLRWIALSFAPSSLLLGVTTYITTDIGGMPLLWVLPLALYLLTFVIVFARKTYIKHETVLVLVPLVAIVIVIFPFFVRLKLHQILTHVIAFFILSLACHGELAKSRPKAGKLTEFYLMMSFGGMLGGVFNTLVAPLVFNRICEYPLAIILAVMLMPAVDTSVTKMKKFLDFLLPFIFYLFAYVMWAGAVQYEGDDALTGLVIVILLAVMFVMLFFARRRRLRFSLTLIAAFALWLIPDNNTVDLSHQRSFFGYYKVFQSVDGLVNYVAHGTTLHGIQSNEPEKETFPTSYYSKKGPLGQLFKEFHNQQRKIENIGAVGLGVGTVACYKQKGQNWTFYEIDPLVEKIARDERYFSFLSKCSPDAKVVIGDARLSLEKEPDGHFDILILDAFSSDSIPVHLMTKEAIELYMKKLKKDGVLAFHISSSFFDFSTVLNDIADDLGYESLFQSNEVIGDALRRSSSWGLIARKKKHLSIMEKTKRWYRFPKSSGKNLWTDDYSNIIGVML